MLYALSPQAIPTFTFSVPLDDLSGASTCTLRMTVDNPTSFTIKDNKIDYSFYPHSWIDDRTATLTSNLLNGDFSNGDPVSK